jgi:cell division protein ZapA (FtsZ GTPase activity inhibitor)
VGWVVAGVWIGVVVLAAVVLIFCGYELTWKSKRLSADLQRLAQTRQRLTGLQQEIAAVQRRVAARTDSNS